MSERYRKTFIYSHWKFWIFQVHQFYRLSNKNWRIFFPLFKFYPCITLFTFFVLLIIFMSKGEFVGENFGLLWHIGIHVSYNINIINIIIINIIIYTACNYIINSLVEIKYTLSILQVYFICTSQKKSTFEVYLVCTSRKKV